VARKLSRVPRADALARMNGAPGELFGADSMTAALAAAQRMLDAALEPSTPNGAAERIKVAARQGVAGARGTFTDILEALTHLLHRRVQELVSLGRDVDARRTASAVMLVEHTKAKAQGNLSPQLLSAALLTSLHRTLRP
jgi:DNA polymerase-3 subunit delta'